MEAEELSGWGGMSSSSFGETLPQSGALPTLVGNSAMTTMVMVDMEDVVGAVQHNDALTLSHTHAHHTLSCVRVSGVSRRTATAEKALSSRVLLLLLPGS